MHNAAQIFGSININEIKWNDNYNFNELLYIRKWVEVECD